MLSEGTKTVIRHALAGASASAADDLYRAKRQFGRLSHADMDKEYGQSGMTCRQLLAEAERQVQAVETARREVEALK